MLTAQRAAKLPEVKVFDPQECMVPHLKDSLFFENLLIALTQRSSNTLVYFMPIQNALTLVYRIF